MDRVASSIQKCS